MRPTQTLTVFACLVLAVGYSGCGQRASRGGIMSQELPLTVGDLLEIREGEKHIKKVQEEYKIYKSPRLETYLNAIAADIAEVSTRPNLPYRVVLLDSEQVNIFGGPGGYIFMTRGLLNFVESESEIAGFIAHEVAHIANYEYSSIPHKSKMKKVYKAMVKGSELARDSIGTYGTAAYYGLKGLERAAPMIAPKFNEDQEIVADEGATQYLMKAGYDPREYQELVERLARIPMEDVARFVALMHTHPPFQDRREFLEQNIAGIDFTDASLEFKQDLLNEVRQMTVSAPDSILFEPEAGARLASGMDPEEIRKKTQALHTRSRRWGWF